MNFSRLPSFVWVIGIVLLALGFIAFINLGFYGFNKIEGIGSLVMLIGGIVGIHFFSTRWQATRQRRRQDEAGRLAAKITTALGVLSFAGMGFALDQPGNPLYNLPLQWIYCPPETQLTREADITRPRPGTTVISQDFRCVEADGTTAVEVPTASVLILRFVEYVLLAYLLIGLYSLYNGWRQQRRAPP